MKSARVIAGSLAVAAICALATIGPAAAAESDRQAVEAVCGKCHSTGVFLQQFRSWDRWNDVFADMTQRGANGTDEQLAAVTTFFLENLTVINVNKSPAEELTGVLGVKEAVAEAIIARRQSKPFADLADLRSIPGVDAAKLEQRKSRILFQ